MVNTSLSLKTYLISHTENILEKCLSLRKREEDSTIFSSMMLNQRIHDMKKNAKELIYTIIERLSNEKDNGLIKWAKELGTKNAHLHTPVSISIEQFKLLREIFFEKITKFTQEKEEVSFEETLFCIQRLNLAIDELIQEFIKSYFDYTNNRLAKQEELIDELHTPVISITDGVAVLPMIGDIDTLRVTTLMEHTLNESQRKEISCLIIDLSGVLVVEAFLAQELFKIIKGLKMTGVEVSITGMKPELAQSAITLGVTLNEVGIYNNLEQALKQFGIGRRF